MSRTPYNCPTHGRGTYDGRGLFGSCPHCRVKQIEIACDECGGTGRVHSHNDICRECGGKKHIVVTAAYAAWKEQDNKRCKCGLCADCRVPQETQPVKYANKTVPEESRAAGGSEMSAQETACIPDELWKCPYCGGSLSITKTVNGRDTITCDNDNPDVPLYCGFSIQARTYGRVKGLLTLIKAHEKEITR